MVIQNTPPRSFILTILLFGGMASPYLFILITGQYQNSIFLLLRSIIAVNLNSISAFMAVAGVGAYVYRIKAGSGAAQDSFLIATLTIPVVLPSLLMVGLLLSPVGNRLPLYFGAAADLYLAGIASLAIVIPIIAIVSHASSIIRGKGTPAGAVLMTMVIYGLVAFVLSTVTSPSGIVSTGRVLEEAGTRVLLQTLFIVQFVIANILETTIPVPPSEVALTQSLQLGASRIYTGTIFALSAALFIYYRLFRRHSEDDVSLEQSVRRSSRLRFSNLTSIGFSILLAVALDIGLIVGISLLTGSAELALTSGLIGMMALIILIGLGDSMRTRLFGESKKR